MTVNCEQLTLFAHCARAKNFEMRDPGIVVSSFSLVIAETVLIPFATAIVIAVLMFQFFSKLCSFFNE